MELRKRNSSVEASGFGIQLKCRRWRSNRRKRSSQLLPVASMKCNRFHFIPFRQGFLVQLIEVYPSYSHPLTFVQPNRVIIEYVEIHKSGCIIRVQTLGQVLIQ